MKPEEKVLAVTRRFYAAMESLDLDQMDQVWLHEDWVRCLHPGWEPLFGWGEVRESWRRIFENTDRMQVVVDEVAVRVEGKMAWVEALEHVTSAFENGFSAARVQVTNLFVERDGNWYMVHHHASPVPQEEEETVQ